jgi:hypothetical protein
MADSRFRKAEIRRKKQEARRKKEEDRKWAVCSWQDVVDGGNPKSKI